MKIYTCYFSGLGDRSGRAVSVCRQQPPGFRLPVDMELSPPLGMLWKFMNGKLSWGRFSQIYRNCLGVLDPEYVANKYSGMILVSWEGYEDKARTVLKNSHRHLIADWLRSNGFECEELQPIPRKKKIL